MMRAIPTELRERILEESDKGLTTLEASKRFGVSPAMVRRLKQRKRLGLVDATPPRHQPATVAHGLPGQMAFEFGD
jgi:transposase